MGGFFGGGASASNMVGATSSVAGTAGLVPAPDSGKSERFLNASGEFVESLGVFNKYKRDSATDVIMFRPSIGTTLNSNFTPAQNTRYFSSFVVPADGIIDELVFRTVIAPNPAYDVHIAVWKLNNNGEPSDYIIGGVGSTGTNSSTDVTISITPTAFKAGFYFSSFTTNTANATASSALSFAIGPLASFRWVYGLANIGSSNSGNFQYVCGTSYTQTTHETLILQQAGASPQIGFRYQ